MLIRKKSNREKEFSGTAEYLAYAQILEDGVYLQSSWGSRAVYQAEYFFLFEMTGDSRDKMLVYIQDDRHEYFLEGFFLQRGWKSISVGGKSDE